MTKIRRRCECGCGNITNYGKIYVHGHNTNRLGKKFTKETKLKVSLIHKNISEKTRRKMSLACEGMRFSEEHKKNISLAQIGNICGKGNLGKKRTKETKLKMSLTRLKYDPNYPYCDIWKDKEYKDDIRKDYCENTDCKGNYKRLDNHHIYLNKKRCAPNDIMTLCNSCHPALHRLLEEERFKPANQKRLYNNK